MCNGDVLHTSHFGYVAQCPHCQALHVSFGTCWLTMSDGEFEFMLKGANQQLAETPNPDNPNEKIFVCETSSHQVKITLNYYELAALSELMNQAACLMAARAVLTDQC